MHLLNHTSINNNAYNCIRMNFARMMRILKFGEKCIINMQHFQLNL